MIYTFFYKLRSDNNYQLLAAWIICGAWFLFNLVFLGIGPEPDSGLSEIRQRYYNLYFHDQYATDQEIRSWISNGWIWLVDAARTWSWKLWWAWLTASLVYVSIAFSDEIGRAVRTASRMIRERGRHQDLPDTTPAQTAGAETTPRTEQPRRGEGWHGEKWIFVREFLSAMTAELAARGLRRR